MRFSERKLHKSLWLDFQIQDTAQAVGLANSDAKPSGEVASKAGAGGGVEEACQQMSWHSGFTSKVDADSRQRMKLCGLNPPLSMIKPLTRFPGVSKYSSEIQETRQ